MEIHYCTHCRKRVSSFDLDEGRGLKQENRVYCNSCARELGLIASPSRGKPKKKPVPSAGKARKTVRKKIHSKTQKKTTPAPLPPENIQAPHMPAEGTEAAPEQGSNAAGFIAMDVKRFFMIFELKKSLAGYWTFDQGEGACTEDISGNNLTALLKNGTAWTDGIDGNALHFNKKDSHADLGPPDAFNPGTGKMSWSVWFRSKKNGTIMSFNGGTGWNTEGCFKLAIAGSRLRLFMVTRIDKKYQRLEIKSRSRVTDGTWHHAAVTWNFTLKKAQLFLDSALIGEKTNTGISQPPEKQKDHSLALGTEHYRNGDRYFFEGAIDEVRIYRRVLQPDEIEYLYSMFVGQRKGSKNEIIVDNLDPNISRKGTWVISEVPDPWNRNSIFNKGEASFKWIPNIPESGTYTVFAWWTCHSKRSSSVLYRISSSDGISEVRVDQKNKALRKKWNLLGTYRFKRGSKGYIEVLSEKKQVCADAVKLVKVSGK